MSYVRGQEGGEGQPPEPAAAAAKSSTGLLPEGLTAEAYPELHNLLQVSPRIYSGGEPETEQAFAALAKLGIRTVVSVDGAKPDVDTARKYGLRYIHIPVGYDGVSESAGRSMARLMRDVSGPIYIHCHHGKHRGPAAAAVACIAEGVANGQAALEVLRRAGTSERYAGLWRDVAAYQLPAQDEPLPELVEVADIDSLTAAMSQIDRATDHLKQCQSLQWTSPPAHPDIVPVQQALLVKEAYRESVRQLEVANPNDPRFLDWMRAAEAVANDLQTALERQDSAAASRHFATALEHCARCHQHYRD